MRFAPWQQEAPAPVRAGVGLRAPHYRALLATRPAIGWLEAHSENYFGEGGQALAYLDALREIYPISLHGVGMSIGSTDPLNQTHLKKLTGLADRIEPCLISEHLSWSSVDGQFYNELLPLPYSEEALAHVSERIDQIQSTLQRQLLIENITAYVRLADSIIPEWAFLNTLAHITGCGLLLDINNVYVNSVNHGFDAYDYLRHIDAEAVLELHLAGFDRSGDLLVDTHGARVSPEVWALYEVALQWLGPRPTLIEWDNDIPTLDGLLAEAAQAQNRLEQAYAPVA